MAVGTIVIICAIGTIVANENIFISCTIVANGAIVNCYISLENCYLSKIVTIGAILNAIVDKGENGASSFQSTTVLFIAATLKLAMTMLQMAIANCKRVRR